jgi:alpha,alpha-trehalase
MTRQAAMTESTRRDPLSREDFDAVLFDLDGVVTATARVHAAAWKRLFDGYLRSIADRNGLAFRPFSDEDYRRYVDGKPRYEGVESFLGSRGIILPHGTPDDPPEAETVCGLGNRKNVFFNEHLHDTGVDVFPSTVSLIRRLRATGMRVAVVSSSKNCSAILARAGIGDLFDLRFDGVEAARLEVKGKPAPDTYLKAALMLGVKPDRTAIVEDAIVGVQAGRDGGFGLVIGVDRNDDAKALRDNGAHIVVTDLSELDNRNDDQG